MIFYFSIVIIMKYLHFLHCNVAGFSFGEGVFVFDQLKIWADLELVYEPENPYDTHAVALYFKKTKIGYIPRSDNKEISKLLEAGYGDLLVAKINRVSPEEHPENQIGIVVFLKTKSKK